MEHMAERQLAKETHSTNTDMNRIRTHNLEVCSAVR